MDIKTVSRTSAIIYADDMLSRKTDTIKRKFVESVFVNNENIKMTIAEIGNAIETELGLTFADSEIKSIVKDNRSFVELLNKSSEDIKYFLTEDRFRSLQSRSSNDIVSIIDKYIQIYPEETQITVDEFRTLINKYLYSLMNTNIAAYQQVINPSDEKHKQKIDTSQFTNNEINIINKFLKWENKDKDLTLFKLVSYCIEYAIIINNSTENIFLNALKNKIFYIDNAIIYRALGINGKIRQQRIISFIKKCKSSGQRLVISKFTKNEFIQTIDYHINLLNKSTPFGRINPITFKVYANGEGFYQFYHEWRNGRITYGFELFKAYILSLYNDLLSQFDIKEEYNVPFDENEDIQKISIYKAEIKTIKGAIYREQSVLFDAQNMYWLECIRGTNNINVTDTKYYFITPDQKLQAWDYNHSKNQLITLLPSQWMGLLLKFVSRSDDDYKSFVSFLSIPQDESIISADNLQTVMAGISEITEDFRRQESIVKELFENNFKDVLSGSMQQKAKAFAKDKLEKEFEKELEKNEKEKENDKRRNEQIITTIKEEAAKQFLQYDNRSKENKLADINCQIKRLEQRKKNADNRVHIKMVRFSFMLVMLGFMLVSLWCMRELPGIQHFIEKHDLSMFYVFINTIITIAPFVYFAIYLKSFDYTKLVRLKKERYTTAMYALFDYSESEYNELMKISDSIKMGLNINNDKKNV